MGFRRRRWRDLRPEEDKVRVNKSIRVPEVRVINEDGQQLGIMATEAARDIAIRVGLDLVEYGFVARRQQAHCFTATTVVDFEPAHFQQAAGMKGHRFQRFGDRKAEFLRDILPA